MVDVAQLVRAPDCGSGGRGFESHHPPHIAPVAQLDRVTDYESGGRRFESCRARHFAFYGSTWNRFFLWSLSAS
jgi:hypothetical protein